MTASAVQGPSWQLNSEYANEAEVSSDLAEVDQLILKLQQSNSALLSTGTAASAQATYSIQQETLRLLRQLRTYSSCRLSVDGTDTYANELQASLEGRLKALSIAQQPLRNFLLRSDSSLISDYLNSPETSGCEFEVQQLRLQRDETLALEEEQLISGLSQPGHHAWGRLYTKLSSTIKEEVETVEGKQELGLAALHGLMSSPTEYIRKSAWQAINRGWRTHRETGAAALNAISGWRLENQRVRSQTRSLHFLEPAVRQSKISRATLDAMVTAAADARASTQKLLTLRARAMRKTQVGPWDTRAPAPTIFEGDGAQPVAFESAMALIAKAFSAVDPSMGEFVEMMGTQGFIEGTVGPNKRPGAYCTWFKKTETPRVFMTYMGRASHVITLAHELGHAYHSWIMRDLPNAQRNYGMSLAETASTFGENLVRDALLDAATSPQQEFDILWADISAMSSFLINIPARYTFEKKVYEQRSKRGLSATELDDHMSQAWREWYGDALSEPDPGFWMSKLHFFITEVSFYNFPYLFGYLFSSGVFQLRESRGETFFADYVALLRDTGRMTAESLARKHLDVDLEDGKFWRSTIDTLLAKTSRFEELLKQAGC